MKILPQPFKWHDLSIWQSDEVFKIGTDAILLGAWIQHLPFDENVQSVLDAGTGTGVVAMALHKKLPFTKIDAIDINESAVSLATINFSNLTGKTNLDARVENIFDSSDRDNYYDLITCNPPYYFNQLRNREGQYDLARHADETVCEWINALRRKLNSAGQLIIIIPYGSSFDWIKCANQEGMYCTHRLDVFSRTNDPIPSRSLLQFGFELGKMELKRLTMYGPDKEPTSGFIEFSGLHAIKTSKVDV